MRQTSCHPLDLMSCSFGLHRVIGVSARTEVQAQVHLAPSACSYLETKCLCSTRSLGWVRLRALLHYWFCSHRSYRSSSILPKVSGISLPPRLKIQASLHSFLLLSCGSDFKIYIHSESEFIAIGNKIWHLQTWVSSLALPLLSVWPQASCLTSLCLSFLFCKMGRPICSSETCCEAWMRACIMSLA